MYRTVTSASPPYEQAQHHRHLLRLLSRSVFLLGSVVALTRVVEMGRFAERTEFGYSSSPGKKDEAALDVLHHTLDTHPSTSNEPYIGTNRHLFIFYFIFILWGGVVLLFFSVFFFSFFFLIEKVLDFTGTFGQKQGFEVGFELREGLGHC